MLEAFREANKKLYIPPSSGFRILSFNVHYFHNGVEPELNIKKIKELIYTVNADIVILQECLRGFSLRDYHKIECINGATNLYLMVFSKIEYQYKVLNIFVYNTPREIILLNTDFGRVACVHLEIGPRQSSVANDLRLVQLEYLSKYDVIVGDCNFTTKDKEHTYLLKKGFKCYTQNINTTPYNRVDLCYSKTKKFVAKTIRCNYSDHLPVIFELV